MEELNRQGVSGAQVIQLRYRGPGYLMYDSAGAGSAISDTGVHWAVQIGDEVFDNLHPDGILRSVWERGFRTVLGGFRESFSGRAGFVTIRPDVPPP